MEPVMNIDTFIAPCLEILLAAIDSKRLPPWSGPDLGVPVSHCVLQPREQIERLREVMSNTQRLQEILTLAFQFGVCQGYAMQEDRVAFLEKAVETLLNNRPEPAPSSLG